MALGYPFGDVVRLLILTGQRRGEVAAMRWNDLFFDNEKPHWLIPANVTKNGRPHTVPLVPSVLRLLEALPRFEGPYVFTTRAGASPLGGWSQYRAKLDASIVTARQRAAKKRGVEQVTPMPDWTLHDLRRTTASGLARLGVPPHVIERVLNHSSGVVSGMAAVYNRHDYSDEARSALMTWARDLESLCSRSTH